MDESISSNSSDDSENALEEYESVSEYLPSDDKNAYSSSEDEVLVSQLSPSKSSNQKKKTLDSLSQPETIDDLFPEPSNQQANELDTIDDLFPVDSGYNETPAEKKVLYPPEGKKVKNPSIVWKFGGFQRKENGSLNMEYVFCGLCPKKYKYNNSPSHLKAHLSLEHKDIYEKELVSNGSEKLKQNKLTDYKFKSGAIQKYKTNNIVQKNFRDNVIKWIAKDIRPIKIVDDKGFRDMISDIDPKLTVPSRQSIVRDIKDLHMTKKKETKDMLKGIDYIACSTDAGSSLSGKTFIDVNYHWIDPISCKLLKKTVEVLKVDSKKAADYRKVTDNVEVEHGVQGKVFLKTTDNENTMSACYNIPGERNGCFSHIQSKASEVSLQSSETLKKLRSKLRKIAKKANKSPKFKSFIEKEQISRGLKPRTLKQEVATRFTATWIMIRSFLNDPNEKLDQEVDRTIVDKNISAVNEAISKCLGAKEYKKLMIKPADVQVMLNIVPLLDILEEGIRLLGGEQFSSGSSVLPFLVNFQDILETNEDDPAYIVKFKDVLKNELTVRCLKNLNFPVLSKASFFDKRYAKLSFLDKIDFTQDPGKLITKQMVIDEIKDELETVEFSMRSGNYEEGDRLNIDEQVSKPKKRKFLSSICDDNDNVSELSFSYLKELERYQDEPNLRAQDNPLEFWKKFKLVYPVMFKLALKYLSVQATSTAAERAMSLLGNLLTKKRLALSDENVNRLCYLSDCL